MANMSNSTPTQVGSKFDQLASVVEQVEQDGQCLVELHQQEEQEEQRVTVTEGRRRLLETFDRE